MSKSFFRIAFFLVSLTLLGAQCISFNAGDAQGAAGGVFKSVRKGDQWQHVVAILTSVGVKNFGGANVTAFAIDPQDHLAVYAGTRENGMFYSFDGAASWQQPKTKELATGTVAAIAIDPRNKCTVYAATGNRIMKSTDCNRSLELIDNESAPLTSVSALTISPINSRTLYAGTSKGAIIKSMDGGDTWSILANVRNKVVDLVVDPRVPSTVYAAISGRGVWRSIDDGKTFSDMTNNLKSVKDGKEVRRLLIDSATPGALLLASKYKISRSLDGGVTWSALPIRSPETVDIFSLAVNPKNSKEIYYGTATTFYRSLDGGMQWSADKLPTKRIASALLVDPEVSETIYLGVLEAAK